MADLTLQLHEAQADCALLALVFAGAERDGDIPDMAVLGACNVLRRVATVLEAAESQLRVNDALRRTMVPRASDEGTGSQPRA